MAGSIPGQMMNLRFWIALLAGVALAAGVGWFVIVGLWLDLN